MSWTGEEPTEVIKKEDKFIVIKKENLDNLISEAESWGLVPIDGRGDSRISKESNDQVLADLEAFKRIMAAIGTDNNYVVCNQDEPYAEDIWQLILAGERKKLSLHEPEPHPFASLALPHQDYVVNSLLACAGSSSDMPMDRPEPCRSCPSFKCRPHECETLIEYNKKKGM